MRIPNTEFRIQKKTARTIFSLGTVLLPIVLAVILFRTTLFPPPGKMIFGMDIYDAYYYWKGYLAGALKEGILPFWNPYNFSGTPFLAHPNINIFYPPNWIFVLVSPRYSFAWYFFLHICIAFWSMYWFVRQLGIGKIGAWVGAVAFSFGGFYAARIFSGHLEYVDATVWIPLVFGLARKALRMPSRRTIAAAGIGMGIQILAGNELFLLFSLEMVSAYIVWLFLTGRKNIRMVFASFGVFMVIVVLGAGLAGIELLPRMEFIRNSIRKVGIPYGLASAGSLPVPGLGLFVSPFLYGSPFPENYSYRGPWPNLFEFTYFVGRIPLIAFFAFLVLGLIKNRTRQKQPGEPLSEGWFFVFLIVLFVYISFGSSVTPNLHEWLWRFTPLYKGIRFPVRHLFPVAFSLAVVCALVVGKLKQPFLRIGILVLVSADLIWFGKPFFRVTDQPTATHDTALLGTIRADGDYSRVLPDYPVTSPVRKNMDFGSAALNRFYSTSDYNSMVLDRYYRFIDLANGKTESSLSQYNVEIPPLDPFSPYVDFLGIGYLIVDKENNPYALPPEGWEKIRDSDRYSVYKRTHPAKRFFLVGDAKQVTDDEGAHLLVSRTVDLSTTVLLHDMSEIPPAQRCSMEGSDVRIEAFGINNVRLRVESPCDAYLSSSEVYYPGWKAKIDGNETKLYLSNYSFRSIFIPKGTHDVVFYYFPGIYYFGGGVSIATACLLVVLFRRKKL